MKLWILKPRENLTEDPWKPSYDKAIEFIVRAETEGEARKITNKNGGAETGNVSYDIYKTGGNPWLDPNFSTCIELNSDGKAGVVMVNFMPS